MAQEVMMNSMKLDNDDYVAIREAVSKLSHASQEQFDTIKKEKWYNRVFDMITFSKKKEKRMAEQISTVAQAQQILIEILLRLSNENVEISNIVRECMEDIRRISENNIYLLQRIQRLEDISLGIKPDNDVNRLKESEKEVLSAFLYKLSISIDNSSEDQKLYANALISYLGKDIQMDNPTRRLNDMSNDAKRIVLACCMEYLYLLDRNFDIMDDYEDFIDEFDLGNKTIKSIREQIRAMYKLKGIDGFIQKYRVENYEELNSLFLVELDEDENSGIDLEEIYIDTVLEIKAGERKEFKNRIVHVTSFIKCEGTLVFDNCNVYYNETERRHGNITFIDGAGLSISNSHFICKSMDDSYFIILEGWNDVSLIDSTFDNCLKMISSSNPVNLLMRGCKVTNSIPFINIISGNIEFTDNIFKFDISGLYEITEKGFDKPAILDIGSTRRIMFGKEHVEPIFNYTNNTIDIDETLNNIGDYGCLKIGAIDNVHIRDSSFANCKNAINLKGDKNVIYNCNFYNCTDVINAADNTKIEQCSFENCYGELVIPDYSHGGIQIDYCTFINIKQVDKYSPLRVNACISLRRRPQNNANYIRKCVFDGIAIGDNFLIASKYDFSGKPENTIGYIEGCDFNNCSTMRSSGKIIKQYVQYDTLFSRDQDFLAIEISGCRGLDNITIGPIGRTVQEEQDEKIKAMLEAGLITKYEVPNFIMNRKK